MSALEKKYTALFKKLDEENSMEQNEYAHILQDEIYRKFVTDICRKKISSLEEIQRFAAAMNKHVVKHDINRRYA